MERSSPALVRGCSAVTDALVNPRIRRRLYAHCDGARFDPGRAIALTQPRAGRFERRPSIDATGLRSTVVGPRACGTSPSRASRRPSCRWHPRRTPTRTSGVCLRPRPQSRPQPPGSRVRSVRSRRPPPWSSRHRTRSSTRRRSTSLGPLRRPPWRQAALSRRSASTSTACSVCLPDRSTTTAWVKRTSRCHWEPSHHGAFRSIQRLRRKRKRTGQRDGGPAT